MNLEIVELSSSNEWLIRYKSLLRQPTKLDIILKHSSLRCNSLVMVSRRLINSEFKFNTSKFECSKNYNIPFFENDFGYSFRPEKFDFLYCGKSIANRD